MAESYEFPDSNTYILHLRKGIRWQDIPPVNGREFTADDVAYHYHRLFGLGSGIEPSPHHAHVVTAYRDLISVTARTDTPSSLNGPSLTWSLCARLYKLPLTPPVSKPVRLWRNGETSGIGITPSAPGRLF